MRILYYDWDEFNGEDCRDAMRRLGHQVDTVRLNMEGFDVTPEIESTLQSLFEKKEGFYPSFIHPLHSSPSTKESKQVLRHCKLF